MGWWWIRNCCSSLGTDSVAAVALTESLVVTLYALAIGLSMATTATVARRTGEHDPEGASTAAAQAILLGELNRRKLRHNWK